jgi:hypothetical protein
MHKGPGLRFSDDPADVKPEIFKEQESPVIVAQVLTDPNADGAKTTPKVCHLGQSPRGHRCRRVRQPTLHCGGDAELSNGEI